MSARLERAELWTDLVWAGGTAVGVLPLVSCETVEEITGHLVHRRLTLAVPASWDDVGGVTVGRVVRLAFDTTGTIYQEYRIREVVDGIAPDGRVLVSGLGVEYDMGATTRLVSETVGATVRLSFVAPGMTPTAHVDAYVDAALPSSSWARGVITPTTAVDIAYDVDTPLAAALKIAAAASLDEGVVYEVSVRDFNGYFVDIGQYNFFTGSIPKVRSRHNIRALRRTTSAADLTTRVYPVGSDGRALGDAWFKVSAVSLNASIDIAEINGLTINPIMADDQFNTTFYWIHEDGVAHQITDTDRANRRLSMASTTGIAVGEWGRIAADSGGTQLIYLDDPTAQATYGVRVGVIQAPTLSVTNWMKNPDMRTWTGASPGKPNDWTTGNATKITTQGLFLTGGQSARITDSGAAGEISNVRSIYLGAGAVVSYSVWLYLDSSTNTFEIRYHDGAGGTVTVSLNGEPAGVWTRHDRVFSNTGAATVRSVGIVVAAGSAGAGALCYCDAMMATVGDAAYSGDLVLGSGGGTNWIAGAHHLATHSSPQVTYDVEMLDLYRVDPSGAGEFDELALGRRVNIIATDLGVPLDEVLRVVRLTTNHLVEHDTQMVLASLPPRLTRLVA